MTYRKLGNFPTIRTLKLSPPLFPSSTSSEVPYATIWSIGMPNLSHGRFETFDDKEHERSPLVLKDTATPTYNAIDLVNAIRHGTVAMPDFQRDFVWNPKNVISLLASVSNRWPIGSILISDRDDHSAIESLRLKNFEGSPAPEPDQVTAIVLDGQQRLTSLLHALVPESSKTMYYVEDVMAIFLRRKLNPDTPFSLTEADFTSLSQSDFNKKYPTIQDRATQGVATVEDISNSSKFFRWISHLNPDQWNGEQWELDELRKDIFGDLEQYNITSLKLS